MVVRLLSLHTAPIYHSSSFTTTTSSRYSSNSPFLCPVQSTGVTPGTSLQLERRHRMLVPVPRAGGAPSMSTYLFAFFLPFSLLVGTIFATLRVGDQLDQKFLEEIEMNIAIMEENDIDIEDISEEIEDENEEETENDDLVTATAAQSRPKQEP